MEKIIACCGLDCTGCEARIATLKNDNELRARTAERWRAQYNAAEITAEMINCTGCREPGVKIGHWSECQIRMCADQKGFKTCAECSDLESCALIAPIFKFVPDALTNLKSLN